MDKLKLINSGDIVTYSHEGIRCRGEVHGWRLCNNGYEHHAVVGNSVYHEHEVSLRSITKRERLVGHDRGTVTF